MSKEISIIAKNIKNTEKRKIYLKTSYQNLQASPCIQSQKLNLEQHQTPELKLSKK